jgi:hypothetical protein
VTSGLVFLSRDENLLTVITGANIMTLLRTPANSRSCFDRDLLIV